jgi:hypothetical protein
MHEMTGPFLGRVGAPELIIIMVILMFKVLPVVLVLVGVTMFVRFGQNRPAKPAPPTAAAGWAADPTGRHQLRYWDGVIWSSHVSDNQVQSQDPL